MTLCRLVEKQKNFYTRLSLAALSDDEAMDMKVRMDALAIWYANLTECMEGMQHILQEALKKELESDK